MILPALPDLTTPQDELSAVKERLLAVKASLEKACEELDAQIHELETMSGCLSSLPKTVSGPNLFESEPVPPLPKILAQPPAPPRDETPPTSIVLQATGPTNLDPDLEQATLEELNKALTQAFAEISGRYPWAQ